MPTEELHITKRQEKAHAPQEVTLRSEEIVIERTNTHDQAR